MPRCLVMSERTVSEAEREGYLQSLAVRREQATAASAHFWVFEDEKARGKFLEFVEAGSREAVRAAVLATAQGRLDSGGEHDSAFSSGTVVWSEVPIVG